MKKYEKPKILDEELELDDIIAISSGDDDSDVIEKNIGGINWF